MPLDVPETPHLTSSMSRCCSYPFTPLLLQPRLATSRSAFLHFTLSNSRLIGLHPTAPLSILGLHFASYIPLGRTGCSPVCGLCPLLSSLKTSACVSSLALRLGHASFLSPLQVQPSSASYSLWSCQIHLRAYLLPFSPPQQSGGPPSVALSYQTGITLVPVHPSRTAPGTP